MLGNRQLVLDTFCEVYNELQLYADAKFWNFQEHVDLGDLVPGAIYLIGRQQFSANTQLIKKLVQQNTIQVVLSNPAEGSSTLRDHVKMFGVENLVKSEKILLLGGGDMSPEWPCLQYDSFLPKIADYAENISVMQRSDEIYTDTDKPYKFLFLNGRTRLHRKYLRERFAQSGLLNQALWTWLDTNVDPAQHLQLEQQGKNLLFAANTVKYLPAQYEVDRYHPALQQTSKCFFVKHDLFNNEWGEIYLKAEPYIDTYFSLVTETVFDYPYSFRTEKIWKPIAMAHPWIAVANQGYYKDLKQLGFQTFSHVIDESFDAIENHQDRIDRVALIVEDLCQQDLASFLAACYNVCKYNQQHLSEMRPLVRSQFPRRLQEFINKYPT
jgi:hypothetical protein